MKSLVFLYSILSMKRHKIFLFIYISRGYHISIQLQSNLYNDNCTKVTIHIYIFWVEMFIDIRMNSDIISKTILVRVFIF